ncbi:FTR1 family iron permease [Floridanema aerugineum]|uniref:FTR1 family protein n=1 Tax=Floridaenema aerugineum BLCC-F46 TaxID=3153654 RepID=A0ABV4XF69_9CYAN
MDFSAALPTFVITLREGVEAALVVGIVLALLKKAKQTKLNRWVYLGIVVGIIASGLVGLLIGWIFQLLSASNSPLGAVIEPFLEAAFGLGAIAMLSWMLIWMTQQAKSMKSQVEGAVNAALEKNTAAGWGIFTLIFIAVLREGFETVLFIIGKFQQGLIPTIGALSGLAVAAGIGVLLFKWGIKINIRRFFQIMGVLLLLIVAGLVISALGDLNEGMRTLSQMNRQSEGFCFYYERFAKNPSCILGPMVWDLSKILPQQQFPGLILRTLFGYTDKLYQVQAIAYVLFLFSIGGLYFRSLNSKTPVPQKNSKDPLTNTEKSASS